MAKQEQQVDVYMVTGFLEAGKTTFMSKFVLPDNPSKKLKFAIISFEEGECEYDELITNRNNFDVFYLEKDQMTQSYLTDLQNKGGYRAIFVEYNGMWPFNDFIDAMPESWAIVQIFNVMNSNTILNENANMRSLVFDKLQVADIAFFNRFSSKSNKEELHKLVRTISRQSNILFQDATSMKVAQDDTIDELPFDMTKDPITIEDRDFAYFYRELCENTNSFESRKVAFKALVGKDSSLGENGYVVGRRIMQCCAADIQFYGIVGVSNGLINMESNRWYNLVGRIEIRYHSLYKRKGPVLQIISAEETIPLPEDEAVATFY